LCSRRNGELGKPVSPKLGTAISLKTTGVARCPAVVDPYTLPPSVQPNWCSPCRKWRGNLVDVDIARVLRLVEESRDAVVRRTGFQMNLLG
jgi:hypothetical protein